MSRHIVVLVATDLVGRLSNRFTSDLLKFLTLGSWRKDEHQTASANGPARDGRRPFGSIRDVVIHVLANEPLGLRARDVHARVELLLGERVSRSSVKTTLALRCQGKNRPFVRLWRGYYLLANRPLE
jgi:hypothetical protein